MVRITPIKRRQRRVKISLVQQEKKKVLVAEGDSWFSYSWQFIHITDVLDKLEDEFGYEVEEVADAGDFLESMAYEKRQINKLIECLTELKDKKITPQAILFSGGGNDLFGKSKEFNNSDKSYLEHLLNYKNPKLNVLNEELVKAMIDCRLYEAYKELIIRVTCKSGELYPEAIPIFIHGYAAAVPDGKGIWGGWWILPGPWLKRAFKNKGYKDLKENTKTMEKLTNRFNCMLSKLANEFDHVTYVDVRPCLSNSLKNDAYKEDWANELHPTEKVLRK